MISNTVKPFINFGLSIPIMSNHNEHRIVSDKIGSPKSILIGLPKTGLIFLFASVDLVAVHDAVALTVFQIVGQADGCIVFPVLIGIVNRLVRVVNHVNLAKEAFS